MADRTRSPGPLGANVRRLRKLRGWSKERLAEASSVATSTISNLELGYTEAPDLSTLSKLAEALEVTPAGLLEPTGSAPTGEWLAAFESSPHAATLQPPLTADERAWLLSFPSATWGHLPPTPRTLALLVEERRRQSPSK